MHAISRIYQWLFHIYVWLILCPLILVAVFILTGFCKLIGKLIDDERLEREGYYDEDPPWDDYHEEGGYP